MQIKDWYKGGSSKHEPVPCRWSGQVDTWKLELTSMKPKRS